MVITMMFYGLSVYERKERNVYSNEFNKTQGREKQTSQDYAADFGNGGDGGLDVCPSGV